ncbi:MAG: hypothetical protein Q7U26_07495 [Aquabacterium sp.]|nr:hypothetical protein [Aquabacterium sp.]
MPALMLRLVAGACLLALLLEGLFRLLPVSTATASNYYSDPMILTYPAGHSFTVSTGWDLRNAQRLRVNNVGFAADLDFTPDPKAVALIGDSHVEASALPAKQRPAAQLAQLLPADRRVFAMGCPGTSLLDYAERVRMAAQRYDVRDMVILVDVGDIRQSLCGSGQINGPCLDPTTGQSRVDRLPPPSTLKQWMRHSALAQYLFSQLKIRPDRLWPTLRGLPATLLPGQRTVVHAAPARAEPAGPDSAILDRIGITFFERIRPYVRGRLVIVIDKPVPGRDTAGLPIADSDRFAALARAEGATVVDMAPAYAAQALKSARSMAIGPYDGHHNALGVAVVAGTVAQALQSAQPWPASPPGR